MCLLQVREIATYCLKFRALPALDQLNTWDSMAVRISVVAYLCSVCLVLASFCLVLASFPDKLSHRASEIIIVVGLKFF